MTVSIEQALKQRYVEARTRIWPKGKEVKTESARQIAIAREREEEALRRARLAAYRQALVDADERARIDRFRRAEKRREERAAKKKASLSSFIRWPDIAGSVLKDGSDDDIINSVLSLFPDVSREEVLSKDLRPYVADVRTYVVYALFLSIGNQSEVARRMGKHPSTISAAVARVKKEIGE